MAFQAAALRLASCNGSPWSRVSGPVAALLASMQRIGWCCPSAWEVVDDRGTSWKFTQDPPAAIAEACKRSVRRWRLSRIGQLIPSLVPTRVDVGTGEPSECPHGTIVVDFAATIGQLLKCSATVDAVSHMWSPAWRGDLASAMSGGQWPQARKAAVPSWGIDDNRCQLCFADVGTIGHRFVCAATCPEGGWKAPPQEASLARRRVGSSRVQLLRTRGLLTLRLPAPPSHEEWFRWLVSPADGEFVDDEVVWYLDGSLLDGEWVDYRATGFGIVVAATDGRLVAYGHGCPPAWCTTAAAAETWALAKALSLSSFPPHLRTDCQGLLASAGHSQSVILGADRPLARAWAVIAAALDGDTASLERDGRLVWMPAHQSMAAIGAKRLSNGVYMNAVDWRANRLVDALAKQAAATRQAPAAVLRLLKSAKAAVRHAAALLGQVTHASNNHRSVTTLADGTQVVRTCRDSAPRALAGERLTATANRPGKRSRMEARVTAPGLSSVSAEQAAQADDSQSEKGDAGERNLERCMPASSRSLAARDFAKRRRIHEDLLLRRRLDEVANGAGQPPRVTGIPRPTASQRMDALKERVLLRVSASRA